MAQFGRALRSGRRGRKFKSCHLDHISFKPHFYAVCLFITGVFSAVPLSSVCLFSAGFSSGLGCLSAPLRERASSPLREFSFRVPLLFLAFFDFGYKNTAPKGAVKLLSLSIVCEHKIYLTYFQANNCYFRVQHKN